MSRVGVVIIGRNEGRRLERCLNSAAGFGATVVYVDSGSTDRSVANAKAVGATVIELPTQKKFTAARARNAGLAELAKAEVDYVQFLDGDVEMQPDWIAKATTALDADHELAVVCGRRRERFPDASVYNTLCDLEWDTPVGFASACGGDAMFRFKAITDVGGYDVDLIAGEEPELCVRLRALGWKVLRLDAEMTLHDAAMTSFGQWWLRNVRNGHAFAEGSAMHGQPPERHWVKETRSNWVWGLVVPVILLALAWPTRGISLLAGAALYALLAVKIYRYALTRKWIPRSAAFYGVFCVLSKFPQMIGQTVFRIRAIRGKESTLIEYKSAVVMPVEAQLEQP